MTARTRLCGSLSAINAARGRLRQTRCPAMDCLPILWRLERLNSFICKGLALIWSAYAASLGRHRGGARIYRPAFPGGKLRRSDSRPRPRRPHPAADLSAVVGNLLYVVDVLRLGRIGVAHRLRIPHYLYRPGANDRAVL